MIGFQVMPLSSTVLIRLLGQVGSRRPEFPPFTAWKVRPLGFPNNGCTMAPAAYTVEGFQSAPGLLIAGTFGRKLSNGVERPEKLDFRLVSTD